MKPFQFGALAMALVFAPSVLPAQVQPSAKLVGAMLDDWYDAAQMGDAPRYYLHFTADAIFLGTDPGERWTISEFRAVYPKPKWTYVSKERHVLFSSDGKVGWWDEKLSSKYGEVRGSGVVVLTRGVWKIAQYNLSFAIPNNAVPALLELLKRFPAKSTP